MCRENIIKLPLTFVDESFSTVETRQFLEYYQTTVSNYDRNFSHRKKLQDKVAASIILQRFIDYYDRCDDEAYALEEKDKSISHNNNDKIIF